MQLLIDADDTLKKRRHLSSGTRAIAVRSTKDLDDRQLSPLRHQSSPGCRT